MYYCFQFNSTPQPKHIRSQESEKKVTFSMAADIIIIYYYQLLNLYLDSSKPIQKRMFVNHEGLSTPIRLLLHIVVIIVARKKMHERQMKYTGEN